MKRRRFVAIVGGAVFGLSHTPPAPGQTTARRIGFLSAFSRSDMEYFLGQLRPELEKLGWTDGRNIVF